MNNKMRLKEKLKAYHLEDQIRVIVVLVILTVLALLLYCLPEVRERPIAQEIMIAVFTSFMVTIIAMLSEVFFAYKNSARDKLISDVHSFGIESLNKNKETAIREELETCGKELWISGYRLIMTRNLMNDISRAVAENGVDVRVLLCPPWSEAYRLVYDEKGVVDNYFEIFNRLFNSQEESKKNLTMAKTADIQIRFTKYPLFSDTYKVDDKFITGPYMLNRDKYNNHITAKDFFSYNITDSKSRLFNLVKDEFESIWDSPENTTISREDFKRIYEEYQEKDYNDKQKRDLLESIVKAC